MHAKTPCRGHKATFASVVARRTALKDRISISAERRISVPSPRARLERDRERRSTLYSIHRDVAPLPAAFGLMGHGPQLTEGIFRVSDEFAIEADRSCASEPCLGGFVILHGWACLFDFHHDTGTGTNAVHVKIFQDADTTQHGAVTGKTRPPRPGLWKV
jgi:hypothetical protein